MCTEVLQTQSPKILILSILYDIIYVRKFIEIMDEAILKLDLEGIVERYVREYNIIFRILHGYGDFYRIFNSISLYNGFI